MRACGLGVLWGLLVVALAKRGSAAAADNITAHSANLTKVWTDDLKWVNEVYFRCMELPASMGLLRVVWDVDRPGFPCSPPAEGVTCSPIFSKGPSVLDMDLEWWWKIRKLELTDAGLICEPPTASLSFDTKIELSTLILRRNQIGKIAMSYIFLQAISVETLQHLDMADTGHATDTHTSFNAKICEFRLLRHLDLREMKLNSSLPGCISRLDRLRHVNLRGNRLDGCRPGMAALTALTFLDLSSSPISASDDVNRTATNCLMLPSLSSVMLDNTKVRGNLSALCRSNATLTRLVARRTPLGTIPSCLTSLRVLAISNSRLAAVSSLATLRGLTELDISGIGSLDITGFAALEMWQTLLHLNFSNSCAQSSEIPLSTVLPAGPHSLFPLQTLDASHNGLTGDLARVTVLRSLKNLHLSHNEIMGGLEHLEHLTTLRRLDLANNRIRGPFPIFGGDLAPEQLPLRNVNLEGNNMSGTLPLEKFFWRLPALRALRMRGNSAMKAKLPRTNLSSPGIVEIDLRGLTRHSFTTLELQDRASLSHLQWLRTSKSRIALIDNKDGGAIYGCYNLEFRSSGAPLRLLPGDTNYEHCVCLGGTGTAPMCKSCPRHAVCSLAQGTVPKCYRGHFYNVSGNSCDECISGMHCLSDGLDLRNIQTSPGYFFTGAGAVDRSKPSAYRLCPLGRVACVGGNVSDDQCGPSYAGALCNYCNKSARFFLGPGGRCRKCSVPPLETVHHYIIWGAVALAFCIFGFSFGTYTFLADTYFYERDVWWRFRQQHSNVLFAFFTSPTTITIFGGLSILGTLPTTLPGLAWPQPVHEALGLLGVAFDFDIIATENIACRYAGVNDWPAHPVNRLVILAAVPVILFVSLLIVYAGTVLFLWRAWVLHVLYYEENMDNCCMIRQRVFPENLPQLVRRRIICFFAFVLVFLYPALANNGLRGIFGCIYLPGDQAVNTYFHFHCIGQPRNEFYIALGSSLVILFLHCCLIPSAALIWLCANRKKISRPFRKLAVDVHDDLVTADGLIYSLRFLYGHFRGRTCKIFGFFLELILRQACMALIMFWRERFYGLLVGAAVLLSHLGFVALLRPYEHARYEVYLATVAVDLGGSVCLVSLALYQFDKITSDSVELIIMVCVRGLVALAVLLHLYYEAVVVRGFCPFIGRCQTRRSGPRSALASASSRLGTAEKRLRFAEPFDEIIDMAGSPPGSPGGIARPGTSSAEGSASPIMTPSTAPTTPSLRRERDIDYKLKAWYYRYSFVERWRQGFIKLHSKIPSRVDLSKDPDLVRNTQRLDLRSKQLRELGIFDPAKAFRQRNLKPQYDDRHVLVPDRPVTSGFKAKALPHALHAANNFALSMSKPADEVTYDFVLEDVNDDEFERHERESSTAGRDASSRHRYKYYEKNEGIPGTPGHGAGREMTTTTKKKQKKTDTSAARAPKRRVGLRRRQPTDAEKRVHHHIRKIHLHRKHGVPLEDDD